MEIATAAESLTRQLLAFSRRAVLHRKPMNMNEAIETAEGMLTKTVGDDVSLKFDLEPDLWSSRLDKGQIQQVLLNLAVNAGHAMPREGTLTIRTRNVPREESPDDDFDGVSLTVIDTGCGMEEAMLSKIFEPFFTTKAQGGGTGLGLAMVFGAVQQSAGTIAVESELGHGTTFRLFFPRDVESASEEEAAPVSLSVDQFTHGVLLVEDDPMVSRVVAGYLRSGGIEVVEAPSPGHALALLERQEFDLVVSDVMMPGMRGDELAVQLRTRWPNMPIIFMTGYGIADLSDLAIDPPWHVLRKPFGREELVAAVGEVCAMKVPA